MFSINHESFPVKLTTRVVIENQLGLGLFNLPALFLFQGEM